MSKAEEVSYTVMSDLHGEYERSARAIDCLEPTTDIFVFAGDVINRGPDSARLISLIRSMGSRAITTVGNHEWACRNALVLGVDEPAKHWWDEIWPELEDSMLTSYGLHYTSSRRENVLRLRDKMEETGDLGWLSQLPPYFATETFIAVHAGPILNEPWDYQASMLNKIGLFPERLSEEPDQIFKHSLGREPGVPIEVDERIFVTGHAHIDASSQDRVGQRRIRLASNLSSGQPLFVWNSLQGNIQVFEA